MAGQIYVGNGYRKMSEKVGDLTEIIEIKIEMDLLKNSIWYHAIMTIKQIDDDKASWAADQFIRLLPKLY